MAFTACGCHAESRALVIAESQGPPHDDSESDGRLLSGICPSVMTSVPAIQLESKEHVIFP